MHLPFDSSSNPKSVSPFPPMASSNITQTPNAYKIIRYLHLLKSIAQKHHPEK